jgi:hypothetical protein
MSEKDYASFRPEFVEMPVDEFEISCNCIGHLLMMAINGELKANKVPETMTFILKVSVDAESNNSTNLTFETMNREQAMELHSKSNGGLIDVTAEAKAHFILVWVGGTPTHWRMQGTILGGKLCVDGEYDNGSMFIRTEHPVIAAKRKEREAAERMAEREFDSEAKKAANELLERLKAKGEADNNQ